MKLLQSVTSTHISEKEKTTLFSWIKSKRCKKKLHFKATKGKNFLALVIPEKCSLTIFIECSKYLPLE